MKKLSILITMLSIIFITTNASHGDQYWAKTYGGSGDEEACYIEQTDDDGDGEKVDGFIVAGYITEGDSINSLVIKLNSDGTITWQKTYGEFIFVGLSGWLQGEAYFIHQTSDGGYILAGSTTSYGTGGVDVLLLKLDSGGDISWQKTYGGTEDDYAFSILETSDEKYALLYGSHCRGCGLHVLMINQDGTIDWQRTYAEEDSISYILDFPRSIQQTADGGFIISGTSFCPFGGHYHSSQVLKLDGVGNVSWMREVGSAQDLPDVILPTSDGGYFLVGQVVTSGGPLLIMKLDGNGNVLWKKWSDPYQDHYWFPDSFAQPTTDGGCVVLGGYTDDYKDEAGIILLKLDSAGNITWQKIYGGSQSDGARSVYLTADGGYIIAGYTESFGYGGKDFFVMKLDSNGDISNCNISSTGNLTLSDEDYGENDKSPSTGTTPATMTTPGMVPQDAFVEERDACMCEADFGCDGDVDAVDVTLFLEDFGRNSYNNPCNGESQCHGDFDCDSDVDASDVTKLLEDFGRNTYNDPCPTCMAGDWCVY